MKKYIVAILLFFVSGLIVAQENDIDLAEYYYNQGMYEQAKLYYEKIYKNNKTNKVYTNYLNTLIALKDFEEAEKLAKRKVKDDSRDGIGYVSLGDLYKKFGKDDLAKQQFEVAIDKTEATRANIQKLANEFANINEYQYALKAYEKGKAEGKDGYDFTYEIAGMKGNLGDYEGMTDSFLDLLEQEPNYLQTVQNSFNRLLNPQENAENLEMLKTKLLKRVQKNPEQETFSELLIWLFMQKKDFASAYVQASALDRRNGENGARMMSLGELALNNKDFETSKKSYQYVIDKGPTGPYYVSAKMEKLQVMKDELVSKPGIDRVAYSQLEGEYLVSLKEVGKTPESAIMMKELAHVQAFYLNKTDESIATLREAIDMPGLYNKSQAICKLELGDVLVFKGEVWDASLLFSQVELDFKEDILGSEAKFRNARISYFTGDFEWAQSQLDVLKASTTKLISNDAIDLSLLITDNFNMDTTKVPMKMFARADLLAYQNRFDESMVVMDSILYLFPGHSLTDEIKMLKGDIYYKMGNYTEAQKYYQDIVDLHFTDITADDALFKLAEMNHYLLNNTELAMKLYERLITELPGSLYVVEARKRFRELRGDAVN
jgi:tetratricopeptide (TPR) repeat protein